MKVKVYNERGDLLPDNEALTALKILLHKPHAQNPLIVSSEVREAAWVKGSNHQIHFEVDK